SFQNLPNLHISQHIVDNAYQYATCTNTAVGTKEIVHRIFKLIVPHTNKKNLELNLLKQVNTLQILRYLADGGIDDCWCIDNNNLLIHALQELDQVESNSNYQYIKFCIGEAVKTTLLDNEQLAFGIVKVIIEHT
ncbi:4958_t:CDS:2, partial [Scutellospora calospora]